VGGVFLIARCEHMGWPSPAVERLFANDVVNADIAGSGLAKILFAILLAKRAGKRREASFRLD
jgi:hypothetical protein